MPFPGLPPLDRMLSGDDQRARAFAKPAFGEAQACALVESVFGLKVARIQPLPSYDDQNFHVCIARARDATDGPTEYVLKINNTEFSRSPELIEVQSCIIMFLRAAGFPTASVWRTKGGSVTSLVSVGETPRCRRAQLCRSGCERVGKATESPERRLGLGPRVGRAGSGVILRRHVEIGGPFCHF